VTTEQQVKLQYLIDRRFDQFSLDEFLDAESGLPFPELVMSCTPTMDR
jgi:hypothetical protein